MNTGLDDSDFLILSLPRSGSTSLARLLNCHQRVRCLVEPFHPRRYGGRFYNLAREASMEAALRLIWTRWNGVKHVWEASGWPFIDRPTLNDKLVVVSQKVIFLMRRNLLRRFVSNYICQHTQYWIGVKEEFYTRLNQIQLGPLDPALVLTQIRRDRDAVEQRLSFIADQGIHVRCLYYEDFYRAEASSRERLDVVNSLFAFLQVEPITLEYFMRNCQLHFSAAVNQWASPDVYRRIPAIDQIENEVGSDETGWLFR
jgi:hypothetical protein